VRAKGLIVHSKFFAVPALLLALTSCTVNGTPPTTAPAPTAEQQTRDERCRTTVLLTNDDGWDAEGISVMYDALVAACYRVTLVAPKVNQSGSSMFAEGGELEANQSPDDPDKWWVDGTPVDSTRVGLTGILTAPPDVVISGINHGANAAYNVNYSGTVGAATAAAEVGVPAIAISADVGAEPSSVDFESGAEIVLKLLSSLDSAALTEMSAGYLVNVNVPQSNSGHDGPRGIRRAAQATVQWSSIDYDPSRGEQFTPENESAADPAPNSDKALIEDGYATLTILSAARDGSNPPHPALDVALEAISSE
jgi:5'-nucleotidase